MFASVIISLALPKEYTYKIPDELLPEITIGSLVEVTLKKIKYSGIVYKIIKKPEIENINYNPILNILTKSPIIYNSDLDLWKWIADYYICSLGEVFNAAVPSILKFNSECVLSINHDFNYIKADYNKLENDIIDIIIESKNIKILTLENKIQNKKFINIIKKLLEDNVIILKEEFINKYAFKKEKLIIISEKFIDDQVFFEYVKQFENKPEYEKILILYWQHLKNNSALTKKELINKFKIKEGLIDFFIKKETFVKIETNKSRLNDTKTNEINLTFNLSEKQQNAYNEIINLFEIKTVVLLLGVTSSGKTLIYFSLIKKYLNEKKQILYLLPEIALTTQMINRLNTYFKGYVYVYHSRIDDNIKKEIWDKILTKEPCIVLGARSAIFLPFSNLGITIIDEEHDSSFKQLEPTPNYNARDVSIYRAINQSHKILLGSATPSIDTLYNAMQKKYGLITLNERYNNIPLPFIHIIDMKKNKFKDDDPKILSYELKEKIKLTLESKKQVIIFHNKRGYAPYLICKSCNYIPYCKHCDVSLTYHKKKYILKCHYCFTNYNKINKCDICNSVKIDEVKFATEHIESYFKEEFKNYNILRLDSDTANSNKKYEKIFNDFEKGEAHILIGTQMISKGLDFENVGLVAIVDGDSLFNFVDYKANEKAFQIIQQVSGRAGRKKETGNVYIQLYNTKLSFLNKIINHEYIKFCEDELNIRKELNYPPFSKLIELTFKHKNKEIVDKFALVFYETIDKKYQQYFTKPIEPIINKIKDKFIMNIFGKLPKDNFLLIEIKKNLVDLQPKLNENKIWKNVIINYNVDI